MIKKNKIYTCLYKNRNLKIVQKMVKDKKKTWKEMWISPQIVDISPMSDIYETTGDFSFEEKLHIQTKSG